MEIELYIHSKCCGVHWELVVLDDGSYDLRCEKCGKSIGPTILVCGTEKQECSVCNPEEVNPGN